MMVDSHVSYNVSPRTMACEGVSHTEYRLLEADISTVTGCGNLRGHACTEDPPLRVFAYSLLNVIIIIIY